MFVRILYSGKGKVDVGGKPSGEKVENWREGRGVRELTGISANSGRLWERTQSPAITGRKIREA